MIVGTLTLHIFIPWSHSLKEKRMVLRSVTQKVRNKYNVSIAEIEDQDLHQSLMLGICCVSNERNHAVDMLQKITTYVESITEAEVVESQIEVL